VSWDLEDPWWNQYKVEYPTPCYIRALYEHPWSSRQRRASVVARYSGRNHLDPFAYARFGVDRGTSYNVRLAGEDGPRFKKSYPMPWAWVWSEIPSGGIAEPGQVFFTGARSEPTGGALQSQSRVHRERVPVVTYQVNCFEIREALSPEVKAKMQEAIKRGMRRVARENGA
jgi:hypothetical protein